MPSSRFQNLTSSFALKKLRHKKNLDNEKKRNWVFGEQGYKHDEAEEKGNEKTEIEGQLVKEFGVESGKGKEEFSVRAVSADELYEIEGSGPTDFGRAGAGFEAATTTDQQRLAGESWKSELFDEFWLKGYFSNAAPLLASTIYAREVVEGDLDQLLKRARKDFRDSLGLQVGEVYEQVQAWLARTLLKLLGGLKSLAFLKENSSYSSIANMAPNVATTALVGQFLTAINGFLGVQNEAQIADYLILEPPFSDHYMKMIAEIKQAFPAGKEDALEQKCTQMLSSARDGVDGSGTWTPFITFMAQYLAYLRDVDTGGNASSYLDAYNLLIQLQEKANSALNHGTLGYLMLPTVVRCAKLVCRLAIGLDKQPELIAHLKSNKAGGADDGPRETLPERAADILRRAFTTCLNDRTSTTGQDGRPGGRRRGIYTIANICLKILFQCRKTRNATMIFENIGNQSPPLSQYPKSERVTYLYYLGRYLFQNGHFYRALLALDYAYDECPTHQQCVKQRRLILVFLTTCNLILGRFPSSTIFQRPEARDFHTHFHPLMLAIRTGNLALFRSHLDYNSPHAAWFLHFRILLPLKNRCEVHVWRSLIRRTWNLAGTKPPPSNFGDAKAAAPHVDLDHLVTAFSWMERVSLKRGEKEKEEEEEEEESPDSDFLASHNQQQQQPLIISPLKIESLLSSLIDQGFLRGFIAHQAAKFAISGTKKFGGGDAAKAGFPAPWEVVRQRVDAEVPGWRRKVGGAGGGGASAGMVVNLSGVRAVGP